MELKEDRIIHRFIRDISEYESGGEYYNQVIPADTQAYAIYSSGEKTGLYYVLGDDAHTYTEIRDGYGGKKSAKEYPVFTSDHVNTINRKADKSYVDAEFVNAETKWTAQIKAEESRATGSENTITVALNDETTRAALEEDKLNKKIDTETNRATTKENTITSNLNAHINNKNNPHTVTKTQVGLGNCDNTSDINKPVSKATQEELNTITNNLEAEVTRATMAETTISNNLNNEITRAESKEIAIETSLNTHIANKTNPHEVTKTQIGLGNCDNTADLDKPISRAVQVVLDKKADKATTLQGYNISDAYTKAEIDNKLTAVYKFKGSVDTYNDLPNKDLIVGDVYNILDTGANYGWTGSVWDKLGENIDLSPYALKSELPTKVSELQNDAGYLTEIPEEYLTVEEAARVYATNADVAEKANTADLATVATSGNYNDLENKPTKVSEFTNDSGYLTEHQDISNKADITYVNEQVAVKQDILSGAKGEVFYSNGNSVFSQTILNESKVVTTTADLNVCKNNAPSFEEVFNTWTKFSHLNGNDNAVASELSAWTYDSSKDTIVQPQNTTSYCGFISPNTYSEYDITVRLYSTGSDNDTIGLVAAFATDPSGKQHTLSFLRSPGGTDAKWICKVDYCTFAMTQTTYNQITLADKSSTITGSDANWSTSTIGTGTVVNMKRNGNVFTAKCSQFNSSILDDNTTITIDLDALSSTYPVLNYFKGSAAWGYSTFSQPYSMYENISVTDPSGYILDVTNNQTLQYDSSSSSWKVIKGLVPTEVIGAGRLSYNKITGKLFYCTGSTIFQIATNANI
ncbi:MAG: hypothetical protein ACI4V7_05280 [Succinivibrionaceae bacterium]